MKLEPVTLEQLHQRDERVEILARFKPTCHNGELKHMVYHPTIRQGHRPWAITSVESLVAFSTCAFVEFYLLPKKPEPPKPRYQHDCPSCKFLGHVDTYDMYYCEGTHSGPALVGRYNDIAVPQVCHTVNFPHTGSIWVTTRAMAVKQGYLK